MKCPQCGTINEGGSTSCVACGAPLYDAIFAGSSSSWDGQQQIPNVPEEEWPELDPTGDSQALPVWLARTGQPDAQPPTRDGSPSVPGTRQPSSPQPSNPAVPPLPRYGAQPPFGASGFTPRPSAPASSPPMGPSIASSPLNPNSAPLNPNQVPAWVPATPPPSNNPPRQRRYLGDIPRGATGGTQSEPWQQATSSGNSFRPMF